MLRIKKMSLQRLLQNVIMMMITSVVATKQRRGWGRQLRYFVVVVVAVDDEDDDDHDNLLWWWRIYTARNCYLFLQRVSLEVPQSISSTSLFGHMTASLRH